MLSCARACILGVSTVLGPACSTDMGFESPVARFIEPGPLLDRCFEPCRPSDAKIRPWLFSFGLSGSQDGFSERAKQFNLLKTSSRLEIRMRVESLSKNARMRLWSVQIHGPACSGPACMVCSTVQRNRRAGCARITSRASRDWRVTHWAVADSVALAVPELRADKNR